MMDKEARILKAMVELLRVLPDQKKDYLLGWVEGAAATVSMMPQQAAERPGA